MANKNITMMAQTSYNFYQLHTSIFSGFTMFYLATLVWVSCGITCVVADLMHRKLGAVSEKRRSGAEVLIAGH